MHVSTLRPSVFLLCAAGSSFATSDQSNQTSLSELYAPTYVTCPTDVTWVRPAKGLNPSEAQWVEARKAVVFENLVKYLDRLGLEGFDVGCYAEIINSSQHENVPHLAFAISGGGWASAYTGTGMMRALDDRVPASVQQRTGGLLQSMLYQTGLSGGSFPTTSFIANDYPSVEDIVKIWKPSTYSPDAVNTTTIFFDLRAKLEAGFPVSIGDFFGRLWGYEFLPGTYGGVEKTFSGFADTPAFKNHQCPMPILHMSSIVPTDPEFFGQQLDTVNGSSYELTPFEFGAWQGDFSTFTPTKFLGTAMNSGSPKNKSACVQGFDKASFMIGSSSSAANMWYVEDCSNGTLGTFSKRSESPLLKRSNSSCNVNATGGDPIAPLALIQELLDDFQHNYGESPNISNYAEWPNPFLGLSTTSSPLRDAEYLKLVDGSENGQTDPLWSLIQPARGVDFIINWDNGQDAHPYKWNNGTAIWWTYQAAKLAGIPFPIIPTPATFIKKNYTHSPVFFGCDANLTTTKSSDSPIILFFANAPYSTYTNYSAGYATMSTPHLDDIFVNSFNQVTGGNGTLDAEFAQCIGCAAIDRSIARVGISRTPQCERCMERYCWHGDSVPEVILGPPGGTYMQNTIVDLEMVLKPGVSYAEWNATAPQ